MVKPVDLKFGPEHLEKLRMRKWAWKSGSVDSFECVNVLQFLKPAERISFANELYRVLKAGAKATIQTPHWASNRAYSDLAFEWPPVVGAWYYHLNREWRKTGNPNEKRYRCDFEVVGFGFNKHPALANRNDEFVREALTWKIEAGQDLIAILAKPG